MRVTNNCFSDFYLNKQNWWRTLSVTHSEIHPRERPSADGDFEKNADTNVLVDKFPVECCSDLVNTAGIM